MPSRRCSVARSGRSPRAPRGRRPGDADRDRGRPPRAPRQPGPASTRGRRPRSRSRSDGAATGGREASVSTWSRSASLAPGRVRAQLVDDLVHGHPSFTLSSSRFSARLSRVETAVGLIPRTRAVASPSSSSTIRSASTSRSPALRERSAVSSSGESPSTNASSTRSCDGGRLLAPPAARLGAEPVERRRPRDPEQPGPGAAATAGRTAPRGGAPSRTWSSRDPRPSRGRGSGRGGSRTRRRGAPRRPRRGSAAGRVASGCSSVIACTPSLRRRPSSVSHRDCRRRPGRVDRPLRRLLRLVHASAPRPRAARSGGSSP